MTISKIYGTAVVVNQETDNSVSVRKCSYLAYGPMFCNRCTVEQELL